MSAPQSNVSAGPQAGHQHIKVLDGVRALSIILVILSHTAPLGPKAWQLNSTAGPMGMSLFFCLSGFLIVSILMRNSDPVSFLIKRVLRIVPSVVMYVFLMVLIFGIGWWAVVENLLFFTNYGYDGRGRGDVYAPMSHLWSLSVEMHFYIFIGVATLFLGRRSLYLVPVGAVVITLLRIQAGQPVNIATHLRVDEIFAGGVLALVAQAYGARLTQALKNPRVAGALLFVAVVLWCISSHPMGGALLYVRAYFAAMVVGIVMFSSIGWLRRLLECKLASYIARISYALYIYHPLMIAGWMNTGSDIERYVFKRPLSYALTLLAAHLSTFYWEAYWQKLATRLTAHRPVVTT